MEFDPVLLSRIQFAFTVSFHIIFPAFTIGLASWLAVLEWRYLKTGHEIYKKVYIFWSRIFAVTFGMGVVSGITLAYQFGTNWSVFSDMAGNVIGPLMGYEVLTAFFLEASFLGIMLFGWDRVGPRLHFVSTCMVAIGTLISTFWIMSANSWMQTPTGHEIRDGIFYVVSWWEVIFNPSMPLRLAHMVLAAYLTTACVVAGIACWYLWQQRYQSYARIMLSAAMWFIAVAAPLQILVGDMTGLVMHDHQPAKVAAIEGRWDTMDGAPLILFALPDMQAETNHFEVGIPKLASWFLTHDLDGTVVGLKEWEPQDRPNIHWVFWPFRVMVGIGVIMLFAGLASLYLRWRGRLYDTRWFQMLGMALTPMGFIAVLTGWFVAEVGRQPYVVYGLLRTADAASPVPGGNVMFSLAVYVVVYTVIFGAGTYYILHLIRKGPEDVPMPGEAVLAARPVGPDSENPQGDPAQDPWNKKD